MMKATNSKILFEDHNNALQNHIVRYSSSLIIIDQQLQHQLVSELPRISIEPGERCKTIAQAELCWQAMKLHGLDRQSAIVAIGGGSTTDLCGFAASCYMRGIATIYVPTTLLGMVDAALGGKTAVNFNGIKNLIGTFHLPQLIIIDITFLNSLPEREFHSGIAEIIKSAIVADPAFFEELKLKMKQLLVKDRATLQDIIKRAQMIKNQIAGQDLSEQGIRSTLNYGHTFAHALESQLGNSCCTHGEAVAIGMSCAAYVSRYMGYASNELITEQDNLCQAANLPTALPNDISENRLIELMYSDKKNHNGKLNLILTKNLGKVFKVDDIDEKIIRNALKEKRREDADRNRKSINVKYSPSNQFDVSNPHNKAPQIDRHAASDSQSINRSDLD